jgi:hypothetical protein
MPMPPAAIVPISSSPQSTASSPRSTQLKRDSTIVINYIRLEEITVKEFLGSGHFGDVSDHSSFFVCFFPPFALGAELLFEFDLGIQRRLEWNTCCFEEVEEW